MWLNVYKPKWMLPVKQAVDDVTQAIDDISRKSREWFGLIIHAKNHKYDLKYLSEVNIAKPNHPVNMAFMARNA